MAKRASVGTPATVALTKAGVAFTVHAYEHDPRSTSYGLEAAEAMEVEPARVLKTLLADVDGRLVVAVLTVALQLDLKALAAAAKGKKAAMADPAVAERSTGYVVGGISPLGQRKPLATFLDAAAGAYETVFVSAGRRGTELELSPEDLVAVLGAVVAPIAH